MSKITTHIDGKVCNFDSCVYDWYVKGIECDNCVYYVPYKLVDGSKILIKEDDNNEL